MADIFLSQTALRMQYAEMTSTQINTASSLPAAFTLFTFQRDSSLVSIRNKTSAILEFYAVAKPSIGQPYDKSPPTLPPPKLMFRLDAGDGYNFDSITLTFPAGSQLAVVKSSQGGAAITGEYLRVTTFG